MSGLTPRWTRSVEKATMRIYSRLMDRLYWLCVSIAVIALVIMTLLVGVGVYFRYVHGRGAFAEPVSIFLAIQLAFYGAAACYRANAHLSLVVFAGLLPAPLQSLVRWLVFALMATISAAMVYYGLNLVQTTIGQKYPEFLYIPVLNYVTVGVAYTAIPISGLFTLLFVIEKAFLGDPGPAVHTDDLAREAL